MRLRLLFAALAVYSFATGPAWADSGISGAYVAHAVNGAVFVALVETGQGHLTGRLEQVILEPGGKLDDMDASITGAVNGSAVVISIKPDGILTVPISASGTYRGFTLSLSGGGMRLLFTRGTDSEFQRLVSALTQEAHQITAARMRRQAEQREVRREAKIARQLHVLAGRMRDLVAKTASVPQVFAAFEARVQAITARMREGLHRERAIWGRGQAALARGQISLAIGTLSLDSNNLHMQFDNFNRPLIDAARSIKKDWGKVRPICVTRRTSTSSLPTVVNDACQDVLAVAKEYKTHLEIVRGSYIKAEEVWAQERQAQTEIQQTANEAVQ